MHNIGSNQELTTSDSTAVRSRHQFGMAAVLWTMLAIAIALAYLRQLNNPSVFLTGIIVVGAAAIVGAAIGAIAGRTVDGAYWSLVIATAALLSVVGDRAYPLVFRYAWSAVGIMTGACCGVLAAKQLHRRMTVGATIGFFTMIAFVALSGWKSIEAVFDLVCAPFIGALVGVMIELILTFERRLKIPRYVTVSWLLGAVVVGNWLVYYVRA